MKVKVSTLPVMNNKTLENNANTRPNNFGLESLFINTLSVCYRKHNNYSIGNSLNSIELILELEPFTNYIIFSYQPPSTNKIDFLRDFCCNRESAPPNKKYGYRSNMT